MCINFELATIDWTAISAVATFIMVLLTYLSLRESKRGRCGIITLDVVIDNDVYLLITNVGNSLVTDLHITFGKNVKNAASGYLLMRIKEIENTVFTIKPQETKKLIIETKSSMRTAEAHGDFNKEYYEVCTYFNERYKTNIHILGTYKNICGKQKVENHIILKPNIPNIITITTKIEKDAK